MLEAYSQLRRLLGKKRMTVPELYRRIQESGMHVNLKSLYRLSRAEPLERLDMRVAAAICEVCDVPLSELVRFEEQHRKLLRLSAARQKRLDILMDKSNEGQLTADERKELRELADEAEEMTLANARILAGQQQALAER